MYASHLDSLIHVSSFFSQIVDMLREYLVLRAEDDDDDDEGLNTGKTIKHSNIGELERLAGQLTLSDTPEKVLEKINFMFYL